MAGQDEMHIWKVSVVCS